MPKYPIDDAFLDEENDVQVTIQRDRYNHCCINRKELLPCITILCCIILITVSLTCINIYAINIEDGSL